MLLLFSGTDVSAMVDVQRRVVWHPELLAFLVLVSLTSLQQWMCSDDWNESAILAHCGFGNSVTRVRFVLRALSEDALTF